MEGQLKSIENARKLGKSHEALLSLVATLAGKEDGPTTAATASTAPATAPPLKNQMVELLMEDRNLSADYGPNHPQVQAVRQRIETMRNFSLLPASASMAQVGVGDDGRPLHGRDFVETYVQYLNEERDRTLVQEETLAKLFRNEYDAARKLNSYEIQDTEFRNGITRTEVLYDGLVKCLQEAGLVKDYGGYEARVIAPAGIGDKVFPSLLVVFAESIFLSLLGGMGLAMLAESTDKSFRTVDEIHRRLELPIMACIPFVSPDMANRGKKAAGGAFEPMLVTYYQPKSIPSESYRAVARPSISATAARATRWCSSPARRRATANRRSPPMWQSRLRSQASGPCSSTPICGNREYKQFSGSRRGWG